MKKFFILLLLLSLCLLPVGCKNDSGASALPSPTVFTAAVSQPKVKTLYYNKNYNGQVYAVLENGDLWRWGNDFDAEKNKIVNRLLPEKVLIDGITIKNNVKKICFYNAATFLLLNDGSLYSWGGNDIGGCLGDGTTESRNTPRKILDNVKDIFNIGTSLSSEDAKEKAAEDKKNQLSPQPTDIQLGDSDISTIPPSPTAATVQELTHSKYNVSAMGALTHNDEVYAWGYNGRGNLCNGSFASAPSPILIETDVLQVYSLGDSWINPMWLIKKDGTVSTKLNTETNIGTTLSPLFKIDTQDIAAIKDCKIASNTLFVLYDNGTVIRYSYSNGHSSSQTFDSNIKEMAIGTTENIFLKNDGTLWRLSVDRNNSQAEKYEKISSNVSKLYNGSFCLDTSGKVFRHDIAAPGILDIHNAADLWDITGGTYIYLSDLDGYLYSWGKFPYGYSPLGIELNPEETQIDMPVQVLFPAGWNS